MTDETIVFLELTFHNTSELVLASRIEQSGSSEKVSDEIRGWAASLGAELEEEPDPQNEQTTFKIVGLDAIPTPAKSAEESNGVVYRVLDYWLEQYRCHGQGVFRERLVIDVPLERVSGRHEGDTTKKLLDDTAGRLQSA